MPTPRQKKAAIAIIENLTLDNPKSSGDVLKSVGYGTGLQNQPKRVLQSEGFKDALRELGLTEELIAVSLVEDIKGKPRNRLGELRLGAEILNLSDPQSRGNIFNILNVFDNERASKIAKRIIGRVPVNNEPSERTSD